MKKSIVMIAAMSAIVLQAADDKISSAMVKDLIQQRKWDVINAHKHALRQLSFGELIFIEGYCDAHQLAVKHVKALQEDPSVKSHFERLTSIVSDIEFYGYSDTGFDILATSLSGMERVIIKQQRQLEFDLSRGTIDNWHSMRQSVLEFLRSGKELGDKILQLNNKEVTEWITAFKKSAAHLDFYDAPDVAKEFPRRSSIEKVVNKELQRLATDRPADAPAIRLALEILCGEHRGLRDYQRTMQQATYQFKKQGDVLAFLIQEDAAAAGLKAHCEWLREVTQKEQE